jgi:glycosyltransferase involved in cell wall biosynthesis
MRASREPSPPRITVVTVVRNGAGTVRNCLESVRRQEYPPLEHVVVDGASTDGTLEVLREYERPGFRWVSEPDGGIYDAMNKAVRIASGDFLLFLGADDLLLCDLQDAASKLVDARTIYYGDAYWPAANRRYDGRFDATKLALRNICHQAVFYPRAVFEKYAFDVRYRFQADWELNMRCFSDPAFRFEYIGLLVSRYDDSGASSRNRDAALEADYPRLLWRHFPPTIALPISTLVLGARMARRLGILPRRP